MNQPHKPQTGDDNSPMEMKDIRRIIRLMAANDLQEFEMEDQGRRIRITRNAASVSAPVIAAAPPPAAAPAGEKANGEEGEEEDDGHGWQPINAPIVGTFYRAASPEAEPFVKVGDRIERGAVCGIIEAMKVMNEIQAEIGGIVRKVAAEDAMTVEYGQPLFLIEPN